jgi:nucleotide-binding universal stress UspA family protein
MREDLLVKKDSVGTYDTVLVALDGSKNAERILPLVVPLLSPGGGVAVLSHVVDERVLGSAAARAYLRLVARRLEARGIVTGQETPRGEAAPELVNMAKRRRAVLIAMTTHGRSGLARFFLGSVAQKVLRSAPCPVLLAKGVGEVRREVGNILVPLDGSPLAHRAVPHAATFARAFGARLTLLYVAPKLGVEARNSKFRRWILAEKKNARRSFATIAASLSTLHVESDIAEGDPATEIVRRTERDRRCLVVISTHGRTGLRRFVLGSVTEKVLQASAAPLLVVRSFPAR